MKTVNITPAGAMIDQARYKIPELARVTLDKYSNKKLKDLKFVTKAFKYTFPFYNSAHQRKAFSKLIEILEKIINIRIPYLEKSKVPFVECSTFGAGLSRLWIRIGPYATAAQAESIMRYLRYVIYIARKNGLPILQSPRLTNHIAIPEGQNIYGMTVEDKNANTYNVLDIQIDLFNAEAENGYLLLHNVEHLLKVLETLHRKAHYAESTFRTAR